MAFYNGPTLITYEEWWAWESKRVKAGKGRSIRKVKRWCTTCQRDVGERYCSHAYEHVVDKVCITHERSTA